MIITVCSVKGGVGKTLLSVVLAETISRSSDHPALLIDLDPQASATGFIERTPDMQTRIETLVTRSAGQIPRRIRELTKNETITILDCPPGHLDVIDAAIGESDLVVIPTQPYLDPLTQALETVAMCDGVPSYVVLNQVVKSAHDAEAATDMLKDSGVNYLINQIFNWVELGRLDGNGWTKDPKILELFENFTNEVLEASI